MAALLAVFSMANARGKKRKQHRQQQQQQQQHHQLYKMNAK